METLDRFAVLANQLPQEEPDVPAAPMPWHARHHNGGFSCCRFCGKPYTDVASMRRHQAQDCREIGG